MRIPIATSVLVLILSASATLSAEKMREESKLEDDTFEAALLKHSDEIAAKRNDLATLPMRDSDPGSRRIVNGIDTVSYPAVGALIHRQPAENATEVCTGTLVGCNKLLTAAHCVSKDLNVTNYSVFFQTEGIFKVRRIDWRSSYNRRFCPSVDR
jgi:V8-like Glu-specific endopeptidase